LTISLALEHTLHLAWGYAVLIMIRSISYSLLVFALLMAIKAEANTDARLKQIIAAFQKIMEERQLISEDGASMRYGQVTYRPRLGYVVDYSVSFPNGSPASGQETIWTDGYEVYVDQVFDGVINRRYSASVEGPYNVLRIRPTDPDHADFITRDCMHKSNEEGTVCYVKVRYMNDVIVTVYKQRFGY
jgi:hypothetical protein